MDERKDGKTPVWKRVAALLGVAAVLCFVMWLFFSMIGVW